MAQLLSRLRGNEDTLARLLEARTKGRLASTLLFSGPSGIGKKLAALSLAQTLVCEKGSEKACGECGACLRVEKGQSESLLLVEPEGSGIKIEQARDVLQFLALRQLGRARVVIIDQAHLMNPQTANALLKSLEEPPSGTYFILVTPLAASVLATIRSRSQLVRFRPLSNEELAGVLKSVIGPDVDPWVIESAGGSVERATRLVESREEFGEVEEAALAYFSAALERFPAVESARLKDLTKDRAAQAFASGLMQGALKNAMRIQGGLSPEQCGGPWREAAQSASEIPARELGRLAKKSLMLEQEMSRNIDRGLLLENFALDIARSRRDEAGGMA